MSEQNPMHDEPKDAPRPAKAAPIHRPGRPRCAELHRKIINSALYLAESNDYGTLSIQLVAREAQVAKTTIYRWWQSKAALLFEATAGPALSVPETGSLLGDLEHLLAQLSNSPLARLGSPIALGLWADLDSSSEDSATRRLHNAQLRHETAVIQEVLMQALKIGDLREAQDPSLALALLKGLPMHLRHIQKIPPSQLTNRRLANRIATCLQA